MTSCPECGSATYVDPRAINPREYAVPYHVVGAPIPVQLRVVRLVCCTACEFTREEK